jgi:hypothetical protein
MSIWDWLSNDIFTGKPPDIYGKYNDAKNTLRTAPLVLSSIRNNAARGPEPPPISSGRTPFSAMADLIRGSAGAMAQNMQPRPPSIQDIIAKLEGLQDPSRYGMDPDALERQARASASAQYDPAIARLRSQMGSAQTRGERNKANLGSLFGQLSGNLAGEIPGIQQQYAGAKQQSNQQYSDLSQTIQSNYAKSQAEQEAMMKRLNIEAAAPDVLDQQQVDSNYFQNLAAKEGQTAQTALGQEETGAVEYTRKGSQMAQVEGTNRQADLMMQLQDLLAQYEDQIGAAEEAKNASYLEQLGSLTNESNKGATDRAQRDFENYIKVIQLGQSLQGKNTGPESVKSPGDVAGYVMNQGIGAGGAQKIQNVFMSALSNNPMIRAGIDQNFGQALSKEELASQIVEEGRRAGLGPSELNALQIAALEYFGRR